jgi:hypothetical protein
MVSAPEFNNIGSCVAIVQVVPFQLEEELGNVEKGTSAFDSAATVRYGDG